MGQKTDKKGNGMEAIKEVQQSDIVVIEGVRAYEKDGVAYINLEDAARGLGFVTVTVKNGVEYTNIRWSRIEEYLSEFGFLPQVAEKKNIFIPENIFYRLAMKAKNDVAERFQALVADEIIPSIRKRGMYATPQTAERMLNDPDFAIQLFKEIKKEREEKIKAQNALALAAPKVQVYDTLAAIDKTFTLSDTCKEINCGMGSHTFVKQLVADGFLYRTGNGRNKGELRPIQKWVDAGLFIIREGYDSMTLHPFVQVRVTFKGREYLFKKYGKERVL